MSSFDLIVSALNELNIDALLVTDFRQRDPYAARILGVESLPLYSRRWFVLIHKTGTVVRIAHRIEPDAVANVIPEHYQSSTFLYSSREELEETVRLALHNTTSLAVCYSPKSDIPIISTIDAGTFDFLNTFGVKLVSAADILQNSFSKLSQNSFESHIEAGRKVDAIRQLAFEYIFRNAGKISEFHVVEFILDQFDKAGLTADHPPCVAVNKNSALPHYEPSQKLSSMIRPDDFVLIDLWAKLKQEKAIYYDITWVGVVREHPSSREEEIFQIVKTARNSVVDLISLRLDSKESVFGYEADRAARDVITKAGYGAHFIHRTGHSISQSVHGEGANLDDFETRDTRRLIPWSCFSVEPGIYLPEFGVRSELNVFMLEDSAVVTGEVQQEIVCMGAE
jgi:Xaa-Pro dipeptidase